MVFAKERRVKLKSEIKSGFIKTLDFFLPRFCTGCDNKLSVEENFLCDSCFEDLEYLTDRQLFNYFDEFFPPGSPVNAFYSILPYDIYLPARKIVHALKYEGRVQFSKLIAKIIVSSKYFESYYSENSILIPIPLNKVKKIERGFNQTELICKEISKLTGIEVSSSVLLRNKFTDTQTKKTKEARILNLANAFTIADKKANIIQNREVIVFDDVITTGATINAAAAVLGKYSNEPVKALSFAVTL
ncbi:MAG: ComF family protein [Ignavibacteriaceae bacterium]|nr:ComF family protein [Ignavibacteriaceae bacterium]